jgi:hypothetical protein
MEEKQKQFTTVLAKANDAYFALVDRQLSGRGITMDDYAKRCLISAIAAINNALDASGVSWDDPQLDQSSVNQILQNVTTLKLNAAANPREVFFSLRNVASRKRDEKGAELTVWKKVIEMGVEGDGNDSILRRWGSKVKDVCQHWLIREQDEFHYPEYNGLQITPPIWKPTGKGKVIRVVYPIIKDSGAVEFHIAEREDVIKNLTAHINNNLMRETFGICLDARKATPDQSKEIAKRKHALLKKAGDLGLEAAIDDEELAPWISPSWREAHSREAMIIRKMRNNIVKKIPKDFGCAAAALSYEEITEEARVTDESREFANGDVIDITPETDEKPQEQNNQAQQTQQPAATMPATQTTILPPKTQKAPF